MLIGKKEFKMYKKALCLIFAFLLSIESFAAVVSDNDGSAFVTKTEFEGLKTNFAEQLTKYNNSIDNKINGAIANYLAGIVRTPEQQEPDVDLINYTFWKPLTFKVWKDGGMLRTGGGITGFFVSDSTEQNEYVTHLVKPESREGQANAISTLGSGDVTVNFLRGYYDKITVNVVYIFSGSWTWYSGSSAWKISGQGMQTYSKKLDVSTWTDWNGHSTDAMLFTTKNGGTRLQRNDSISYDGFYNATSFWLPCGATNVDLDYVIYDKTETQGTSMTLSDNFELKVRGGGANQLKFDWTWPYFNQKKYTINSSLLSNYPVYNATKRVLKLYNGLPLYTCDSECKVDFDIQCEQHDGNITKIYINDEPFENEDVPSKSIIIKTKKLSDGSIVEGTFASVENNELYNITFDNEGKKEYYIKLDCDGSHTKIIKMSKITITDI